MKTVFFNNNMQKGSSLLEYALLVALIAMLGIASVRSLGQQIAEGPLQKTECALAAGGGLGENCEEVEEVFND